MSACAALPGPPRSTCASPAHPPSRPCFYGVDTPSKKDLIAASNSVEEIRQFIEADSLAYLSLDRPYPLLHHSASPAHGLSPASFCTACYTGAYPTQWVDVEEILPAAVSV